MGYLFESLYNMLSNIQKLKEPEPAKERLGLKTMDTTYHEELDLVKVKLKCLMHLAHIDGAGSILQSQMNMFHLDWRKSHCGLGK